MNDTPGKLKFENATLLGNFTNREEWLEARKSGIGGSEVAAICGVSKWSTAYSVWAEKVGLVEGKDLSDNEAVYWGNVLEDVVIDEFAKRHPEYKVLRDVGTWQSNEYDWQRANPDAIYVTPEGEYGVLEIKTAMYETDWAGDGVDRVPPYYETQVLWYLQTLFGVGKGEATVAVLFHGNKYREYTVKADAFVQQVNLELVRDFMTLVQTGTAPDTDGGDATYDTLRKIYPGISNDVNADVSDNLYVDYLRLDAESKDAYKRLQAVKSAILEEMKDAKTGLVGGVERFVRVPHPASKQPYLQLKKGTVK